MLPWIFIIETTEDSLLKISYGNGQEQIRNETLAMRMQFILVTIRHYY